MSEWMLTEEELGEVVEEWLRGDSSRRISLNRGHDEDIRPVIARAALRKVARELMKDECTKKRKAYFGWLLVSPECKTTLLQEAGMEVKEND